MSRTLVLYRSISYRRCFPFRLHDCDACSSCFLAYVTHFALSFAQRLLLQHIVAGIEALPRTTSFITFAIGGTISKI